MSVISKQDKPTEGDAVQIARAFMSEPVVAVERFKTGLRHYVYDVSLKSGRRVVVRMADTKGRALLEGGVYWSKLLRARGVPLPALLHEDVDGLRWPFSCVVLERFE